MFPPTSDPPEAPPRGRPIRPGRRIGLLSLAVAAGCSTVRVDVETRLTTDPALSRQLAGPAYALGGVSPEAEASLVFQEAADLWAAALAEYRPHLRRASHGEPAAFRMTLGFNVLDLGTGVVSYPEYGPTWSHLGVYSGCGYHHGYAHGYGYVGQRVETVHLGYDRSLLVVAWIEDPSQPAGRRVIWEGFARSMGSTPSLKVALPFLAAGLAPYFGQATEEPVHERFTRHSDRIESLRRAVPQSGAAED